MKKKLILFLGISFLFFSCASTNAEKVDDVEETGNIENFQTTQEDDETQEEPEQNQKFISEQYQELEDLTEPEITDLEWQEEQKSEDTEETKLEEDTELVENEEELSPIEELKPIEETENQTEEENQTENQTDENIENQTENDEILQENSNNESSSENNNEDDEIIDLTENDSDDDIIEILEDSSDSTPEENVEPIIIVPSRKVTLNIGQTLEVLYPGSGWIYMGTTDNTKDFSFLGKKLGTENTKFTFKAKKQGNKILHFYKNDILTQNYIDDYLEVEILSEKDSSNKTVQAPEYKQLVPKKVQTEVTKTQNEDLQIKRNNENTQINQTTNENISSRTTQNSSNSGNSSFKDSSQENQTENDSTSKKENQQNQNENNDEITKIDTTTLLEEAESLYNEKNYKDALSKLETYIEYSKDNRDKALYLQGQIYETDGEYKNVKKAIESYKMLTKNYPTSSYWDSANKRIIYLTKFYLEGR